MVLFELNNAYKSNVSMGQLPAVRIVPEKSKKIKESIPNKVPRYSQKPNDLRKIKPKIRENELDRVLSIPCVYSINKLASSIKKRCTT